MTKHASILGRELSIHAEASMLGSTPCSKNISDGPIKWLLLMNKKNHQSNVSNSVLNNNNSLLLFVWEFHGTFKCC